MNNNERINNSILDECLKEASRIKKYRSVIRDEMKKKIYQKIREEIEDGKEIKYKISITMSHNKTYFHYFINKRKMDHNQMHYCYDIVGGDCWMDSLTAKEIFETTKYGDKILVDLFKEKFPLPFNIMSTYLPIYDEYCVLIYWHKNDDCVLI